MYAGAEPVYDAVIVHGDGEAPGSMFETVQCPVVELLSETVPELKLLVWLC